MRRNDWLLAGAFILAVIVTVLIAFGGFDGLSCQPSCHSAARRGRSISELVCCLPGSGCMSRTICITPWGILKGLFWLGLAGIVIAVCWRAWRGLSGLCGRRLAPVLGGIAAIRTKLESLDGIAKTLGELNGKLEALNAEAKKIGSLDVRLQQIEATASALHGDCGKVDTKIGAMETKLTPLSAIKDGLADIARKVSELSCQNPPREPNRVSRECEELLRKIKDCIDEFNKLTRKVEE
jgi:hypothetical protein